MIPKAVRCLPDHNAFEILLSFRGCWMFARSLSLHLLPLRFIDLSAGLFFLLTAMTQADQMPSPLEHYLSQRESEFEQIPAERKLLLEQLANLVQQSRSSGQPARLTFICTHNSRRSHLCQIWAAVAAARYHISDVEVFSGGTEVTAFNPRAVAALRRAGLEIPEPELSENPRYEVHYATGRAPLRCFSKVYSDLANPSANFVAVMTCADADEACPIVAGAAQRVPLRYEDPKRADGTPEEAAVYDLRCAQIAREMLYAFSRIHAQNAE
jgi:protein-tyrosine-phosphatase